jgi:hypothetical protein
MQDLPALLSEDLVLRWLLSLEWSVSSLYGKNITVLSEFSLVPELSGV